MIEEQVRWGILLSWLKETHGMTGDINVERKKVEGTEYYGLYTKKPLSRKTILFSMPKSAMINSKTLRFYAAHSLSAVQLISLHLLLHRPGKGRECLDPLFGPYISTLPRNFDYHPLTWMVKGYTGLQLLPPSVTLALQNLSSKFRGDLAAICSLVHKHSEILESSPKKASEFVQDDETLVSDYLWAWLNVNTRCIYYQVKNSPADPDNLALCPILDFANHSSYLPCMTPSLGRNFSLLSPETPVPAEQELFLKYGAHCNRVLFTEYGFVLMLNSIPEDQRVLEVNVDDVVEALLLQKGEAGVWIREILELENYWRDWTMHFASGSAFLSYRLITALRLISIFPSLSIPLNSEEMLRPWKDVINGRREELSPEYESTWRNLLRHICSTIIERASQALANPGVQAHESIVILWDEEHHVAKCVLELIQNGKVF